jgi:hypothetical protein
MPTPPTRTKKKQILKKRETRIDVRVTAAEKVRFAEQAKLAGLSLSDFARSKMNGDRVVSSIEKQAMRDLRSSMGLLKLLITTRPEERVELNGLYILIAKLCVDLHKKVVESKNVVER